MFRSSVLLRGIHETITHPVFDGILNKVCAVLDDQVHRQRAAALKRIEQCYAVKSGFDGFLDVARTNFCHITERIHALANRLQEEHRLESIKALSHLTYGAVTCCFSGLFQFEERVLFSCDRVRDICLIPLFHTRVRLHEMHTSSAMCDLVDGW